MILDYIAHLRDGHALRAHLLAVSDEIAALHAENAALRDRLKVMASALDLCRAAASAGIRELGPDARPDDAD